MPSLRLSLILLAAVYLTATILTACGPVATVAPTAVLEAATTPIASLTAPPPEPAATQPLTATPLPSATLKPPPPTAIPEESPPAVLLLQEPPIRHPAVERLQRRLFDLGCREVGASPQPGDWNDSGSPSDSFGFSGAFDAQTAVAVMRFELFNGLAVDGAVDAETAAVLDSPAALGCSLPPPFAGRVLRRGMYVHAIEMPALDRLTALGYRLPGHTDTQGKFNSADAAALLAFQADNELPATGALDLATWERLFSPLATAAGAAPHTQSASWLSDGFASDIFAIDGPPVVLALAGGKLWAARADGALVWIEPDSGRVHGPIFLGDLNMQAGPAAPEGMAVYGRTLFVYSQAAYGQVLQGFDIPTGLARPPVTLLYCPGCSALHVFGFDGQLAWLSAGDNRLRGVNPFNGAAHIRVTVEGLATGLLAFDGACLWAPLADGSRAAVDPGAGTCRAKGLPGGLIASDGRSLWVTDGSPWTDSSPVTDSNPWTDSSPWADSSPVAEGSTEGSKPAVLTGASLGWYSAASAVLIGQIDLPAPATALLHDGAHLWVAATNGEVRPILPATGQVGAPVLTCPQPSALASDGKTLWVACAGDATVRRINLVAAAAAFPTPFPKAVLPTRAP